MAHRLVLAVAAVLAGCLDIPDPPGSGGLVGVSYDGTSIVRGPDYALRFATDLSHMPVSVQLTAGAGRDAELLWAEPAVGNDTYDGIGIGIPTVFAINIDAVPDPANTGFSAEHAPIEMGPARVVVDVTWDMTNWPAAPFDPSAGNYSRFTFYPDARIVRHDHVTTHALGTAVSMASYTTLGAAMFARARVDEDGLVVEVDPDQGSQNAAAAHTGSLCLFNAPEERVAVMAWRPPDPFAEVEMLLAPVPDQAGGASLVVDWVRNADVGEATYDLDTLLALRATGTNCDAIAPELAHAFQMPPALAGATYQPSTAAYRLDGDVRGGALTVTAQDTIPPGFAIEATSAADVSRNGEPLAKDTDYLEQSDASGAVLWFPTGLSLGDELVLTPRP
jgi:hypothetical protein